MQDDMQVVGNIKRLLIKLNIILKCHNLIKRRPGNLKTQGYIDLSVGASFIPYNENSSGDSKPIKMFVKNHNKKLMQKMSYKAL